MSLEVIPESALASLEVMEWKSYGKRFSVFRGDAEQELKGAGGVGRMKDFKVSLWGVLDALGLHFASFFRLRF